MYLFSLKSVIFAVIIKNQLTMNRTITTILACICYFAAYAQSGRLFNTDHQLSSNLATQVFQDNNGFIWIATRNGLNVFDGYNFRSMRKGENDPRKPNTNCFNCITQDSHGCIVLGTNRGVLIHDDQYFTEVQLHNEQGKTFSAYIPHIKRLHNGNILIGTSGCGIYLMKKGTHTCIPFAPTLGKLKYIHHITEDRQGQLWLIADGNQLFLLNKKGQLIRHAFGTQDLNVRDIQQDSKGTIYLATESQGIYRLTPGSSVFTQITAIPNLPASTIFVNRNDRLFIGCNGEGITLYDPVTNMTYDNLFFSPQTNLSKSKVGSIIEDQQGNIWFSMLQKGVFMQPLSPNDFGYMGYRLGKFNLIGDNSVSSVMFDKDHNLWVGTDKDGIYKLSPDGKHLLGHYAPRAVVLGVCQDTQGRIWIATYTDGAGTLDANGTYHPLDIEAIKNTGIYDIKCDKWGYVWLTTLGEGVFRISPDGAIKNYKMIANGDNNPKANCPPSNYIVKLAFSKDNSHIYFATSAGLACLDRKKESWTSTFGGVNCLVRNSFSHCVFVDSKDQVWYGTDDGAYCHNQSNPKLSKHYTTTQGLTDNSVCCINEDYLGRIWMGTSKGMSCINFMEGRITRLYAGNGIQSNEFSDGATCISADKRTIVMGGTGGINKFDVAHVKLHPWKANVILSGLLVNNEPVMPYMDSDGYTITEHGVYDTKEFHLSHEDNSFTLQLSTLTYNNVEQIVYAYSINDEEWRKVQSGVNEISFSHLLPGTYHFKVKALCNSFETPVKEFTIVIHPAWYASIWAKFVYFLIILGILLQYQHYRKRQEESRLALQQHIHAEEMGEAKLRFFMNISHEIRTPLTLILTPLLSLIKEDKDAHRQGIYNLMRKNSERILHLISQMMDLRKIDKGQMAMHMSETDMVSFIKDEHQLFEQQAIAKQITFTFLHQDEHLPVWIDRNNFDKVLMNVLSNAFKFTPAGGKIQITLSQTTRNAIISIKDSGKGIDKDKLETIFQRFYQSPTHSNDRNVGTGIGLDLTRSLVELHYGTIFARNNESTHTQDEDFKTGSEFIITLPLGKAHLKTEEILEEKAEEENEEDLEKLQEIDETLEGTLQAESQEPKPHSSKSTIAIVEDDEEILHYLSLQLGNDFTILTYPNGKVALPEIIKTMPDLVISDIMMPEMDGNTLCSKIKNNVNTNHLPVILLTAMSREESQLAGLETGADAYITKPFNMDILRRTILNLLAVRRTLRNKFMGKESPEPTFDTVETKSPDDELLKRIMEVINENMSDSDLSVDVIAQKVGISRVHLNRKMKELTNQTPHNFIRNIRLKQAAKLLLDPNRNVTDVMYACGFSNAASFSTMFKNLYGCSPREYMNKAQEENP